MAGLRGRLAAGDRLIGSFAAIPHPVAVEVMAAAGPDFLCIDQEHGQIDRGRLEEMIRAADVHRVPAMVRVPGHQPEAIQSALDSGAAGVLVPRIGTAAQALAAVAATRYPPLGQRGVGPGRAAGYGYKVFDYLAGANDAILLAIQVETAEGLAHIDEIVAVEGIDLVFIGPGDLSVSIGALGPEGAERLAAAIDRIVAAAARASRPVGIFRPGPADVAAHVARGITFFLIGSDAMALDQASRQMLSAARA